MMDTAALRRLLGTSTLTGKSGDVEVDSLSSKKYILLYFSAHWCPPCRAFTPALAKCYNKLRESRDDFEIIFCSSDSDEASYTEYYKEMPWVALPFAKRKEKEKLSKKFRVRSIPTLIVLDEKCGVVTAKAREAVPEDPEGKKFPWAPRQVYDVLGEMRMTSKDGKLLGVDDLKQLDAFALYFSAHWCAPCRAFTPKLVSLYKQITEERKIKTEFIFCSSDRDEASFAEYYAEMPWAAAAFMDPRVQELKEILGVDGIPTLVTIGGKDGAVICPDGRGAAVADDDGSAFPWKPVPLPPVADLVPSDAVITALNENVCCILALNGCANADTPSIEFTEAGKRFHAEVLGQKAAADDAGALRFLICGPVGADLFSRVVQVLNLQPPQQGQAMVLIVNLSNEGAKEVLTGEVTRDSIFAFAKAFYEKQTADE